MRFGGFASLPEALCRGCANVTPVVIQEHSNLVCVLRGGLRLQDHGENGHADIRTGITEILDGFCQVRLRFRPEPREELESLKPDTLGRPWPEQSRHRIGSASLAPVG